MQKIKFDLPMNGGYVHSFEQLQANFTASILPHFHSGLLMKWLEAQDMEDKARAVRDLPQDQEPLELLKQLCEVLELEADEEVLQFLLNSSVPENNAPPVTILETEQTPGKFVAQQSGKSTDPVQPRTSWLYPRHPLLEVGSTTSLRETYLAALLAGFSDSALEAPALQDSLPVFVETLGLDAKALGDRRALEPLGRDERFELFSRIEVMNLAWVFLMDLTALQALGSDDIGTQDMVLMDCANAMNIKPFMPLLFLREFVDALGRDDWPRVFRTMSDLFFMMPQMHPNLPIFARAIGAERMELKVSMLRDCRHKRMPLSWNRHIGEHMIPRQRVAEAGDHIPDRSIAGFFATFISAQEPFCSGDVIAPAHGILAEIHEEDSSKVKHGQVVGAIYAAPRDKATR